MLRILLPLAVLLAVPVHAAPPRDESPAPRENLEAFGSGSSDEEIAAVIAAANAHPLGTPANPIRVAGPDGARRYIARLRCPDGSIPHVGRDTPGPVGAFGTLTTLFPLSCGSAAPAQIAFDLYQEERIETRPPPGFLSAS
jgi:hypothetical protein